jgi:hypothetical protein
MLTLLNYLKTKLPKLCIMVYFVPRCKHTASLLWKPFYETYGNNHFFYVSLTAHLSITLANEQLDAQIFNTFITFHYMF